MKRAPWKSISCLMLFSFVITWLWYYGYRLTYQPTSSMPKGFYLIYPADFFMRGDVVVFYPPQSIQPFLRTHPWAPAWLMKRVVGIPGDLICIKNEMVFINGEKIAKIQKFYAPAKKLPHLYFCRQLENKEYFLLSPSVERSFDSRYFGVVRQKNIIGKAKRICL